MRKFITAGILTLGLAACNSNTEPGNDRRADLEKPPQAAQQEGAAVALENVAPGALYPGILTNADVASIGGVQGRCVFRMTQIGFPSFVYGGADQGGTIKLNGKLIMIPASGDNAYSDAGLTVEMRENEGAEEEATMIVRIPGAADELGFRGYSNCNG